VSYLRGREARPASRTWNVVKTLAQTAMFWTTFLFLLPAVIVTIEHNVGFRTQQFGSVAARWVGGVLFLLGGSLGITSGVTMAVRGRGTPLPADCPIELVIAGPYCHIRNPMVIAGLSQGIAVGIFLGAPSVIAYAMLGGPVWHLLVRPWEEADLEQSFGASYRRYCAEGRCWLPR
jgi:protein-S-isoprenylcysteine O-methyltransferase Ste14